jgi:hypothetical protein
VRAQGAQPAVTVVMPVRDAAAFVGEALDSVLAQTYTGFEIVVVDDASTDGTADVLRRYADPRVRLIRHPRKGGVAVALNTGISSSRSRYVARMDADDVALPERLAQQVRFLDRNPSIGIVGANMQPIGSDGRPTAPSTMVPTLPGHVRWMLHVHNCVNHPTVVARREVFQALGGYRLGAVAAEDYDLWIRAMDITRIANIPDVLLHYRVHPSSTSVVHQRQASAWVVSGAEKALTRLLGSPPDRDAVLVLRHPSQAEMASLADIRGAAALLWAFTEAVVQSHALSPQEHGAIRRTATQWFAQLVRATARRRPASAARLLVPGATGPPAWVFGETVAAGWRRVISRESR